MRNQLTRHCPVWCIAEHRHPEMPHEGRTGRISGHGESASGEAWFEVRAVHYQPLEDVAPDEGWSPFVEVAHHSGGRYQVVNLEPVDAIQLAQALLRSADEAGSGRCQMSGAFGKKLRVMRDAQRGLPYDSRLPARFLQERQ